MSIVHLRNIPAFFRSHCYLALLRIVHGNPLQSASNLLDASARPEQNRAHGEGPSMLHCLDECIELWTRSGPLEAAAYYLGRRQFSRTAHEAGLSRGCGATCCLGFDRTFEKRAPIASFESVQATLTALFGAPHFPTPHLKGAGFGSRRPGSRSDFGRGPSPRPVATRQLGLTHPQRVKKLSQRDSFQGRALGSSEARRPSFSALQVNLADDCHHSVMGCLSAV